MESVTQYALGLTGGRIRGRVGLPAPMAAVGDWLRADVRPVAGFPTVVARLHLCFEGVAGVHSPVKVQLFGNGLGLDEGNQDRLGSTEWASVSNGERLALVESREVFKDFFLRLIVYRIVDDASDGVVRRGDVSTDRELLVLDFEDLRLHVALCPILRWRADCEGIVVRVDPEVIVQPRLVVVDMNHVADEW